MSRLPALGPKGEGWVLLQVILIVLIVVGGDAGPRIVADDAPAADALRLLGRVLVLGAVAWILWSYARLRSVGSFTAVPRPRADGSLVESGPYRVVRHPLYAGLVAAGIGTALVRLSWIELALTAALFVVLDMKRRREESWLVERYPGYASYRMRTKALIPFVY